MPLAPVGSKERSQATGLHVSQKPPRDARLSVNQGWRHSAACQGTREGGLRVRGMKAVEEVVLWRLHASCSGYWRGCRQDPFPCLLHLSVSGDLCWLALAHGHLRLIGTILGQWDLFYPGVPGGYLSPGGLGRDMANDLRQGYQSPDSALRGRDNPVGTFPAPEVPVGSGGHMVPKLSQFFRDLHFSSGSPCPWGLSILGRPGWLVTPSSAEPMSLFGPMTSHAYFPTSSSRDPTLNTLVSPAQLLLQGDQALSGAPPSLSVGQFSQGLLAVDDGHWSLPTEFTAELFSVCW